MINLESRAARASQALACGQRGAPTGGELFFECMNALDVGIDGFRRSDKKALVGVRRGVGASSAARRGSFECVARRRSFWGRRRGSVWVTSEVIGGSVCVRVPGVRARVRWSAQAERVVADSTNSSAFLCSGEPAVDDSA